VPLVDEVVVEVVPVVDVAEVWFMAVPDVSVTVLDGIAEVVVLALVSVAIVLLAEVSVAVADVSVALTFVSFLQANPKSARAATVRRTRIVFFMFNPFVEVFPEVDMGIRSMSFRVAVPHLLYQLDTSSD